MILQTAVEMMADAVERGKSAQATAVPGTLQRMAALFSLKARDLKEFAAIASGIAGISESYNQVKAAALQFPESDLAAKSANERVTELGQLVLRANAALDADKRFPILDDIVCYAAVGYDCSGFPTGHFSGAEPPLALLSEMMSILSSGFTTCKAFCA